MGDQDSAQTSFQLRVNLLSNTPVVGCEINPLTLVSPELRGSLGAKVPPHSLTFTWYREQITCSVDCSKLATVQCTTCAELKIPIRESCHCSTECFLDAWSKHLQRHGQAAETGMECKIADQETPRKLRSCGSWPDLGDSVIFGETEVEVVVREGKEWVKVGSSKTYVPTMDDAGFSLRLESVATDSSTGSNLTPVSVLVTDPVIPFPTRCPRYMIQLRSLRKSSTVDPTAQHSNDVTFSVLSYNILADLYANKELYSYCPTWALAWEYRRENLLQEIIEYDADIICLQEVQSDHFEGFFKPELTKRGYSVMYKKKTKEVYTANKFIIDGCATFYRHDVFKEIMKYELEFDKMAFSVVGALDPKLRNQGSFRLMKDNVALVVILEAVKAGTADGSVYQSRICVANTHIHANPNFPDTKLCQVALLVQGLEEISKSQVPLLICGDFNSLPESDPHEFLVKGGIESPNTKRETDPLGISQLLKLHHSLPLVSAYASLFGSEDVKEQDLRRMDQNSYEPLFTNFRRGFSGTLDYILYTADSLRVEGLLELLDAENLGVGLPSPQWSSDHIALKACFSLKPPSDGALHPPPPLPPNPRPQAATA